VRVLGFLARFLADPENTKNALDALLNKSAVETGLFDAKSNHDIFHGAFFS
jgi:hypothetical protein